MTLTNFLILMIAPVGALVIAAVLIVTTRHSGDDGKHAGPAE